MLDWVREEKDGVFINYGNWNGETYAYIVENKRTPQVLIQFKGLKGADLDSDGARISPNIETGKKICEGMMRAWVAMQ